MARKNVNEDVKSNKKAIKKEVEEYSADEVCGYWPRLAHDRRFKMRLIASNSSHAAPR